MTSSITPTKTVTLDLETVRLIMEDMGYEELDVQSFWRQALREKRDPGCLLRQRKAYWEKVKARL
jgi:3-isopropylmalate dehydratase small subunit